MPFDPFPDLDDDARNRISRQLEAALPVEPALPEWAEGLLTCRRLFVKDLLREAEKSDKDFHAIDVLSETIRRINETLSLS